jgi:hypothetical protein
MTVSAPAQKGVDVESGPAPAHPLTEPGRTTVQLLVASSAVLALLQLVAATSVDVYNGERAGWWVAIQGATVAFAAAFAGAAAGANGAWWRRVQQKSSSTTGASLGTGVAAAGVAGAVFAVLCWASSSLENATYPMALAVLVAALLGGVVGGIRAGGAALAGLVSTFVATLVNLTGQAFTTIFVLAPAVADGSASRGTPLPVSAVTWAICSIAGTVAGVWWLSRRRLHTTVVHCLIIALLPVALVIIGDIAELLAWLVVSDPAKGDALKQAAAGHGVQVGVMLVCGVATGLIAGRALRTRRDWPVKPSWMGRASALADATIDVPILNLPDDLPPAPEAPPAQWKPQAPPESTVQRSEMPARRSVRESMDEPTAQFAPPAEWKPTTGITVPPGEQQLPVTTARRGNGVVKNGLNRLIPTQQQRRDEANS